MGLVVVWRSQLGKEDRDCISGGEGRMSDSRISVTVLWLLKPIQGLVPGSWLPLHTK